MHVVRVRKTGYVDKTGQVRDYESAYLRRTYREGGKVRNETVANLSALPAHVIDWIDAGLKGARLVPAEAVATVTRSLPHGAVAAVRAQASALGFPALLGPPGRARDLALALVISRVVAPGSKLSTLGSWADTTLGVDLEVAGASTDEVYAAMDWLLDRQDRIEARLAARHLGPATNPGGMALFDLSSSWVEGSRCPLAARGYSRDGKRGKLQIEYGLLTDPEGRPVAVRVFAGNTADPAAFVAAVEVVRERFGLAQLVMVGDRGMITSARIDALRELGGTGWLTALRAPQIAALAADQGPLQLSLFDQQDLAEISHPDYPGERLIACRNPLLATERARKRAELLAATEAALAPILAAVTDGRLIGADQIGLRVGKVVNTYKMAKHFQLAITDTTLTITRRQTQIDAEAALDGIYVLRTSIGADRLDPPGIVLAYKDPSPTSNATSAPSRPTIWTCARSTTASRTESAPTCSICTLAAYLIWHLRRAWAPLTYTDEHPPARHNPVAPATRSTAAATKASRHHDHQDQPLRSFRGEPPRFRIPDPIRSGPERRMIYARTAQEVHA